MTLQVPADPVAQASRASGRIVRITFALIAALTAVVAIIFVPRLLLGFDGVSDDSGENLKHIADTRSGIIQLFGGMAAGVGLYFTWRNYIQSSQAAADAREQAARAYNEVHEGRQQALQA